nr:retrovirus-related Pol polyprotein from transposon TNT 1-94 [Tanacetum cinerariifolium]
MQMVGGNGGNQFRQHAGQNVGNLNGYNDVQNIRNQVIQHAVQNPRIPNVGNQNGLIGVPGNANQNPNRNGNFVAARAEGNATGHNGNQIRCYNCRGVGHFARNCTVRPRRMDAAHLQTQLLIAQKEEAGIQLQAEEFDLMAAAADLDEIEEVNAKCILMANLQQASTSGTQTDKALVYDSDGSAEVHNYEDFNDNEIFNMFTQEEQYTELLEPIPEPHQVLQNDNIVIAEDSSMEQTIEVEKVNTVNHKLKETNAELTTELARFKNQEKCFEISQEKYDKLERCYQKSVYQEQCLSKKINALHLSFEKKKLKSDFKICEDELLDKQIQLEKRIKELDNILVKTGQSIQMIYMLSPKPDSFYHTEQKMALGYQNPFYLKQDQQKQQSLYDGKVLLEKHDPPVVHDSEETLMTLETHNWSSFAHQELYQIVKDEIFPIVNQVDARVQNFEIQFLKEAAKFVGDFKSPAKEADESLAKHKALELEIERLLRADLNYAKENAHLKTTYKNLFDSISVTRTQTKTIIDSLQNKLHNTIYENAKLRAQLFDKVSDPKDTARGTSANTKFAKQSILEKPPKVDETHALSKPVTSNSNPTPQESKVVINVKVIALGMFRINPFKPSREEKHVPNKVRASTRRPQPRSNTKNDRVPSASKSSQSNNKKVEVEEHHKKLLLSRNKKHMSSECNNDKLATQNVKSKVIYAMCKQCLNSVNHDVCFLNYVNGMTSRGKKQSANVSIIENQKKQKPKIKKTKKVGSIERLASPKPSTPRSFLRWSPTGRLIDLKGKIIASSESESQSGCSKGDNACTSNLLEPTIKRFPNSTFSLVGNSNMFMVRRLGLFQAYDQKSTGVDLLKGNRSTNLYTINLHEMASALPICLMAHASSTKSWLWHQRLSHLNFDTINDLAKNDLVSGLPKFKYHKEHLCPSCEQGKSERASHPPKPVPNSRQRLHLLHMDLCGPIRIASINRKRTKKIMETMSVSFDELSTMAFEQRSSKPGLQSMTSGQMSPGLDLTYAPSTITTQQPTEGELDLLLKAMYDDYIGCQLSSAQRTVLASRAHQDSSFELTGFPDADYTGCKDTFKSTFGGAQFLGEKLVRWSLKKQDCMTLSTAKAEYVSLSACCAQVIWMWIQLTDYGFHFNKILIYCDSKSAIAISYNPVQHSRTKHIAVRYHFIKEHVEKGTIELYFVKTDYQLADLFTKALRVDRFNYLVHCLGMHSLSPQELDRLAKSK